MRAYDYCDTTTSLPFQADEALIAANRQLKKTWVNNQNEKLARLVVLPTLLAGCTSAQMNMLMGTRNKTYNDINAMWVGSTEEQLISKWGPPKKSYTLESGAKIISYEDIWGPISAYHVCSEKFMIDKGMVTKWGISNCPSRASGTLPADTPIPQPTL